MSRRSAAALLLTLVAVARPTAAAIPVGDRMVEVVDMHLHPGHYGQMAPTGRRFIAEALPPFVQLYAPALLEVFLQPFAPHVGIRAQCELAGVDHAVLYATYTQHTTGYFTNSDLEAALLDPQNRAAGGPFAWGLVSVDFDGWSDAVAAERLAVVDSYLAARPDLFIGIKLAHAHQGVALDDVAYQGIYAVAARHGVPVLLHTGFSPFPMSRTTQPYYDPEGLAAVVAAYDGAHGMPRVDFVLSHVGQGDARSVAHALALAEAHDNVLLELSALGRPLLVDADGAPVMRTEPQLPGVLAAIRARGLSDRALFATDGPQYSGMVRSYLARVVAAMQDAGFSTGEIAGMLSGNFHRVYTRAR